MNNVVVVIGGSAGALDGLLSIVPKLPDAFVPMAVVIHLSPTHPNRVPEVLESSTHHRVVEAEDKQPLEAGVIYVAPPNYHLLIERDRTLSLSIDPPVNYSRPSIDVLFESAADALGPNVVGVLLSGANDDGAHGLVRIHEAGGRVFVQKPETARHPTMPTAAIQRLGAAATVLSLDDLATSLIQLGGGMESSS